MEAPASLAQEPRRRLRLIRFLWACCLAAASLSSAAAAAAETIEVGAIEVAAQRVPLNAEDTAVRRVGRLLYRGGLVLAAADESFGGWSALRVNRDGRQATLVSDRGAWLELPLVHDQGGDLVGVGPARLGRLIDPAGRPLVGYRWADAEGLAAAPDGGWLVSFEHYHRIWHYPAAEPPFSLPPRALPTPPELGKAPANGGLEVLARLVDGRLLALTESLTDSVSGDRIGWVGDGRHWARLTYRPGPAFDPTDAAALPGSGLPSGDLVVLERRFGSIGLPAARLARVSLDQIKPGAAIDGAVLALIEPPLTIDNFEGVDTRVGPRGETLLYLVSDDNFFALQRTLLLMFEVLDQ